MDKELRTPLHLAAENNHVSAVKYLFEKNADMEVKDDDGDQPIHLASRRGHFKYVTNMHKY